MTQNITLDTSSIDAAERLLSLSFDGVYVSKIMLLEEHSRIRLLIAFASGVAINLFSSALYDVIKNLHGHETSINGKQVPADEVQLNIFINSQVQINQAGTEAKREPNSDKNSHD